MTRALTIAAALMLALALGHTTNKAMANHAHYAQERASQ